MSAIIEISSCKRQPKIHHVNVIQRSLYERQLEYKDPLAKVARANVI